MALKKALIVAVCLGALALGVGGYRFATGRCPLTGRPFHCTEESTHLTDPTGSGGTPRADTQSGSTAAPKALAEETGREGTRGGRVEQPALAGTPSVAGSNAVATGGK
jgi:hypothetical protein